MFGKNHTVFWVFIILSIFVLSCKKEQKEIVFESSLPNDFSDLNIYNGDASNLSLAEGVIQYEVATPLFTDFAFKQRLLKLPPQGVIDFNSNGNAILPDGTLLIKTFFYFNDLSDTSLGKQLIESRVLLLKSDSWVSANYVWRNNMNAKKTYSADTIPISWVSPQGTVSNVNYEIPSSVDCRTCHASYGNVQPLGVKASQLNHFNSSVGENQLHYFHSIGIMDNLFDTNSVSNIPKWKNTNDYTSEELSRGYFDVNCAHCHSPGGSAEFENMNLKFETDYVDSGIYPKRNNIVSRVGSTLDSYKMPKIGRTLVDDKAHQIIDDYVDGL